MSQSTIEIMREHRKNQIEKSPSSELFSFPVGGSFRGIFDQANFTGNKDSGNMKQSFLRPLIMVDIVPAGLTEQESVITREDGIDAYTFYKAGTDKEGIPILWLS